LKIKTDDVPIFYLNSLEYYKCIKSNSTLPNSYFENIEFVKQLYINACEITPGMYKYKEKKIVIKSENNKDFGL
jgi:hypothetical protein